MIDIEQLDFELTASPRKMSLLDALYDERASYDKRIDALEKINA